MPTVVRSCSKINLGLAIGPPRPDGFHGLLTIYQTLALHDRVTVSARPAARTSLEITSNDPRVPRDARNTAWKMVTGALEAWGTHAEVSIAIRKLLPVQGGMGAGSANAAAALLGVERELARQLTNPERQQVAAAVGSDVPLFLIGGTVLGWDRGQLLQELPDITVGGRPEVACVIALPTVGVSTPTAFRRWDERFAASAQSPDPALDLHNSSPRDTMRELSRTYSSVFQLEVPSSREAQYGKSGASGIFPDPSSAPSYQNSEADKKRNGPENLHGHSREQLHTSSKQEAQSGIENDLAENSLLALVRTGIENDFEEVVFREHPSLREIKRQLMGSTVESNSAIYAGLSGSGSALFGLYRSQADAQAAQQRVQQHGTRAIVTSTISRSRYWSQMFAE